MKGTIICLRFAVFKNLIHLSGTNGLVSRKDFHRFKGIQQA